MKQSALDLLVEKIRLLRHEAGDSPFPAIRESGLTPHAPAPSVSGDAHLKREEAGSRVPHASPRFGDGYAFPWPDVVPGFGTRRVVPFELCSACGAGTWVMYGPAPLCLTCARGLASSHDGLGRSP